MEIVTKLLYEALQRNIEEAEMSDEKELKQFRSWRKQYLPLTHAPRQICMHGRMTTVNGIKYWHAEEFARRNRAPGEELSPDVVTYMVTTCMEAKIVRDTIAEWSKHNKGVPHMVHFGEEESKDSAGRWVVTPVALAILAEMGFTYLICASIGDDEEEEDDDEDYGY